MLAPFRWPPRNVSQKKGVKGWTVPGQKDPDAPKRARGAWEG